jgi:hypothetical protein
MFKFIFLLPLVVAGCLHTLFYLKSRFKISSFLIALSLSLFPIIFGSIRNLGPFFGGADIGAGLIILFSSIGLTPVILAVSFSKKTFSLKQSLKISGTIIVLTLAFSGGNHYILLKQARDFKQKSLLDCQELPLHCAIRDNNLELINRYAQEKSQLEKKDGWGRTALMFSYYRPNRNELFRLLLQAGANPQASDASSYTIVHSLLFQTQSDFEGVNEFIKSGFNLNQHYGDKNKMLLLTYAISMKNKEIIDFLFFHRADPFIMDGYGKNACESFKLYQVSHKGYQEWCSGSLKQ